MLERLRSFVVVADENVREGFVVAQDDVEARLQALDEVGFEQKRLGLAGRDDELHRAGERDHARDALGVAAQLGVGGDARLQVARLADVKQFRAFAEHAVDARPGRQAGDLVANHIHAQQSHAGRRCALQGGGVSAGFGGVAGGFGVVRREHRPKVGEAGGRFKCRARPLARREELAAYRDIHLPGIQGRREWRRSSLPTN